MSDVDRFKTIVDHTMNSNSSDFTVNGECFIVGEKSSGISGIIISSKITSPATKPYLRIEVEFGCDESMQNRELQKSGTVTFEGNLTQEFQIEKEGDFPTIEEIVNSAKDSLRAFSQYLEHSVK